MIELPDIRRLRNYFSAYNLGIIFAKADYKESDNPYTEKESSGTLDRAGLWLRGYRDAHDISYKSLEGKLLKDKPLYELASLPN